MLISTSFELEPTYCNFHLVMIALRDYMLEDHKGVQADRIEQMTHFVPFGGAASHFFCLYWSHADYYNRLACGLHPASSQLRNNRSQPVSPIIGVFADQLKTEDLSQQAGNHQIGCWACVLPSNSSQGNVEPCREGIEGRAHRKTMTES